MGLEHLYAPRVPRPTSPPHAAAGAGGREFKEAWDEKINVYEARVVDKK